MDREARKGLKQRRLALGREYLLRALAPKGFRQGALVTTKKVEINNNEDDTQEAKEPIKELTGDQS